jgi:hypothetical protein
MNVAGFTPGFRFKNGKLCIFHERAVAVLNTWPDLTAVTKKEACSRWQAYWPAFRVIHPYRRSAQQAASKKAPQEQLSLALEIRISSDRAAERKHAFNSFRFSFPKGIANLVERFPIEQWSVLHLLKADPQAMDLVSTHPAIAFLLAHHYIGRFQAPIQCPRLSHLKQKVLVQQFGFPATDAVVNILKKVPAESASLRRLGRLRDALGNPEIQKVLSHLGVVNAGVIELAGDSEFWRQTSPRLLREVSESLAEKYRADTAEALHQILIMQQALRKEHQSIFQSRNQLLRVQDELALEYCQKAPAAIKACVFPRPPLPGAANCIIPLRTPADLLEEGDAQDNCVATYAKRVEDGDVFIYRVLFPERATLSVVRGENGTWERGELKTARNASVSPATERAVEEWLMQHTRL